MRVLRTFVAQMIRSVRKFVHMMPLFVAAAAPLRAQVKDTTSLGGLAPVLSDSTRDEGAQENPLKTTEYLRLAFQEQKIAIEQAQLRSRRLLVGSVVGICLLAFIYSVLLVRHLRRQRRLTLSLKQSNEELEQKNRKLQDNDAFHQKLISVMSHDLRQPLSSMLMLGDEGMVAQMTEAQWQYVFNQISLSARTSLQAMDGLVHWMKLNTIGLAYTPSVVRLRENMLVALDYNRTMADQKGIVIMDFVSDSIDLLAQSEMLLFVNRNVLSNAIRHTPEGGQIVVTAMLTEDDHTVVRISDSGEGIPQAVLPHLFDRERSETAQGGSGLALIICREMIEKMNGRIWAANNSEGGASFYYRLPNRVPLGESIPADTAANSTS